MSTPPTLHTHIQIYTHPSPHHTLLPHLLPLLPYTLPLVRRIQFHFHSPHAHVLSTLAPSAPPPSRAPTTPHDPVATPFLAAYLDRSRAPETQCWLFSSIELPSCASSARGAAKAQLRALWAWVRGMRGEGERELVLVGSLHGGVLGVLKGEGEGDGEKDERAAPPIPPADLIHGSTDPMGPHARGCVRGHTAPTMKFLFAPPGCNEPPFVEVGDGWVVPNRDTDDTQTLQGGARERGAKGHQELPDGLAWSTVHETEYALARARTAIPRQDRTLRLLASVGVRRSSARGGGRGTSTDARGSGDTDARGSGDTDAKGAGQENRKGELIAWGFLGPDGSLTSLHVEAEFRGRGIGTMVTGRLFGLLVVGGEAQEDGNSFLEGRIGRADEPGGMRHAIPPSGFHALPPSQAWAHSDVYVDNAASAAVARRLGGREGWCVYWAWVDLDLGAMGWMTGAGDAGCTVGCTGCGMCVKEILHGRGSEEDGVLRG